MHTIFATIATTIAGFVALFGSFSHQLGAAPFINSTQLATSPSSGQCLKTDGSVNSWGACGGGSGVFPFSADTNYGQVVYSTSTPTLWLKSGLFASSTSRLVYASTTAVNATTICLDGDTCRTTWPTAGSAFPWTPTTYAGVAVNATSTGLWFKATSPFSLIASSTFATNASSTQLGVSGNTYLTGLTSKLLGTDTTGLVVGTTSIGVNYLAGVLPIANGGTGQSTFTSSQLLYGNGTNALSSVATTSLTLTSFPANLSATIGALVGGNNATWTWWGLSTSTNMAANQVVYGTAASTVGSEAAFTYAATGDLLTVTNASTTALTASAELVVPAGKTVASLGEVTVDDTTGQLRWYGASAQKVNVGYYTITPSMASTTWGSGTTTIFLGPATAALTFSTVQCDADTFLGVSLYDGTNRSTYFVASSTIGTVTLASNNTFTAGEAMRVDIGTSTAPNASKHIACRFKYTFDAD